MSVTGKTDTAAALIAQKLNVLQAQFDIVNAQLAAITPAVFCIWAEENGALGANAYEWSYGNGATGNDIGTPMGLDCELFAATFNADVFGGPGVSIEIRKNLSSIVHTPLWNANNTVVTFATPSVWQPGDLLSFRTATVAAATTTDARIFTWWRAV